jgi:hypothetical protein
VSIKGRPLSVDLFLLFTTQQQHSISSINQSLKTCTADLKHSLSQSHQRLRLLKPNPAKPHLPLSTANHNVCHILHQVSLIRDPKNLFGHFLHQVHEGRVNRSLWQEAPRRKRLLSNRRQMGLAATNHQALPVIRRHGGLRRLGTRRQVRRNQGELDS